MAIHDPLLSALKRQLKAEKTAALVAAKPAAAKTPELSEQALLEKALKGVRPLRKPAAMPPEAGKPAKPSAQALQARAHAEGAGDTPDTALSDMAALMHPIAPEALLRFKRDGVQLRQLDQLKQGKLPWRAAVDLHGCTLDEARSAVTELILHSQREGLSVVKVVHGKGSTNGLATLKTAVNGWLKQIPEVLAFVSAPARDGGNGAVLILLKRNREAQKDPRFDKPEAL